MRISDWSSDVCSSDLKTTILTGERRVEEALNVHEQLVARAPGAAVPWMNYGHALKTVGRLEEAVAAYRRSLEIDPANGFAWRSEERRVGQEGVSTCRSWGSTYN